MKLYRITVEVSCAYWSGSRIHHAILTASNSQMAIEKAKQQAVHYVKENGDWQQTPSGLGSESRIEPPVATCVKHEELTNLFVHYVNGEKVFITEAS